jgi:hypothetical protein
MKRGIIRLLEGVFVWTVGPVVLFFSPQARKVRHWTLGIGGVIASAWWTGFLLWMLGALVAIIPGGWLGEPSLSEHERFVLERQLSDSVDESNPVYQHTMRMERRVPAWAAVEGVHPAALQAAVLLHDSTLEHPRIPEEGRFCMHGNTAAALGLRSVRQLDRSWWYAVTVTDAVLRHVGPGGFNWEWQDKRLVSKRCENRMPTPVSREGKLLYDLDMMDKVTVASVVDAAATKRLDPAFKKKNLQEILKTDKDSVLKEISDHVQTLQTGPGKACGRQVAKQSALFIKNLDYRAVRDISALRVAAARFAEEKPAPGCLENPRASDRLEADDAGDVPTGAGPLD